MLRAGDWQKFDAGQDIVKEGELDDRFYVVASGMVEVETNGNVVGKLGPGECFGETSYVRDAMRTATIRASTDGVLLRVSSTLLETLSTSCQLRFNRVFLRSLIQRLQSGREDRT